MYWKAAKILTILSRTLAVVYDEKELHLSPIDAIFINFRNNLPLTMIFQLMNDLRGVINLNDGVRQIKNQLRQNYLSHNNAKHAIFFQIHMNVEFGLRLFSIVEMINQVSKCSLMVTCIQAN